MDNIYQLCRELRLTYIRDNHEILFEDARRNNWDYDVFLCELLRSELELRTNNGITRRLKEAKFPVRKYLTDFIRTKYPPDFVRKFDELETLNFIANKENIILIGTPGAGKTHYATAHPKHSGRADGREVQEKHIMLQHLVSPLAYKLRVFYLSRFQTL